MLGEKKCHQCWQKMTPSHQPPMRSVHRYSRYLFELESSNWAYQNPPRVAGRTHYERSGNLYATPVVKYGCVGTCDLAATSL